MPPAEVVHKVFFNSYVQKIKESVENLNGLTKENIKSNRIDRIVIKTVDLTEPDVDYLIRIREFSNPVSDMREKNWFDDIPDNDDNNGNHGNHDNNDYHDNIITTNNNDNALNTSNQKENNSQGKTFLFYSLKIYNIMSYCFLTVFFLLSYLIC